DQVYEHLGNYEQTCDSSCWKQTVVVDLFSQPMGLTSETSAPVSVLEWNEQQYFAALEPKKGDLNLDGAVTVADISALMNALSNPNSFEAAYGLTAYGL